MKKKLILLLTMLMILLLSFYMVIHKDNTKVIKNENNNENNNLISVLVDGVEQSAFPSKGSAEYQSTSCTNGETAVWDEANWKLSIQDISASTRCVVSFVTGGHNVYVTVSGGTVDNAPKNVPHNGNVTFTVTSSNSNYVFSSVKCSGANSYTWANNILSVNGVTADAHCEVVFSRPTYTVYFNVVGGYTEDNYVTVVRGGGNSTTFGAIPGYLTAGSIIECDPGITGKISGTRIVISNVVASGDCKITCSKDSSYYLPGGAAYPVGGEVSYANLKWLVVGSDEETVTLILAGNATYKGTSSSNTTGVGIFGSGVDYTTSSAKTYIDNIWLQQDAQQYLRTAIESEGLKYQADAKGYVRLPHMNEVSKKIPNESNTSFWTMDNDNDGHVYYGQPDGYGIEGKSTSDNKYYYEFYTLATNTDVSYSNLTLTGCSGSGNATSKGYYSTTCGSTNLYWVSNYNRQHDPVCWWMYNAANCSVNGIDKKSTYNINQSASYNGQQVSGYVACAGTTGSSTDWNGTFSFSSTSKCGANNNTYIQDRNDGNYGCANTCVNTVKSITGTWSNAKVTGATASTNPTSENSYEPGQYSNGYVKWIKNVQTGETKSSEATLKTALTFNSTTKGNSGIMTGVQAVSPNESNARTNDTKAPVASTHSAKNYTASNSTVESGTLNNIPGFYQGYSFSSCADTQKTSSFTGGKITNPTCTAANYTRYTLQAYNSADIGYRPVIVVYKAN